MTHRTRRHRATPVAGPSWPPTAMRPVISVRTGSPCALIQVSGSLTAHAASALRTAMQRALANRPAAVVIDLAATQVDDARQAEAMLVLMKRHARRLGANFVVAAPAWLRERTEADALLTTTATLGEALELASRAGRVDGWA